MSASGDAAGLLGAAGGTEGAASGGEGGVSRFSLPSFGLALVERRRFSLRK